MRKRLAVGLFLIMLVACSTRPAPLAGRWIGRVPDGEGETEIVLDFRAGADGVKGTMSLPGRRLLGKAVRDIVVDGNAVSFTLPAQVGPLHFEGRAAGDEVRGEIAGLGVTLVLHRAPSPPTPYREIPIDFPSSGLVLHGSLLIPDGSGPFPAVILIHGSSTPDRNDFRYFADLYARQGIAAFIYDKRPTGAESDGGTASLDTLAGDVVAAAQVLARRPELDPGRIGLWGFSQGGWVAPIAATRRPFAFVALLSPPGVSFAEVTLYADAARLRDRGVPEAQVAEAMSAQRHLDLFVRHGGDAAGEQARLDAAQRHPWSRLTTLPARLPTRAERGRYLRWIDLDFDPTIYWRRIHVPVFIAYGTRDENVPAEESARRIANSLDQRDVTLRRYEGANHSLSPAPHLEADLALWSRTVIEGGHRL